MGWKCVAFHGKLKVNGVSINRVINLVFYFPSGKISSAGECLCFCSEIMCPWDFSLSLFLPGQEESLEKVIKDTECLFQSREKEYQETIDQIEVRSLDSLLISCFIRL